MYGEEAESVTANPSNATTKEPSCQKKKTKKKKTSGKKTKKRKERHEDDFGAAAFGSNKPDSGDEDDAEKWRGKEEDAIDYAVY